MSRTAKFNFGPGSLEETTLKVWTAKRDIGNGRQFKLSFTGQYMIYCGYGNEHTFVIDIMDGAWSTERDAWAMDVEAAREGDPDAAYRLATSLLGWTLDSDWSDPCSEDQSAEVA